MGVCAMMLWYVNHVACATTAAALFQLSTYIVRPLSLSNNTAAHVGRFLQRTLHLYKPLVEIGLKYFRTLDDT